MRIYVQLPFKMTEFAPPARRAQQANTSFTPEELTAFQMLSAHEKASKVTPKLLAFQEKTQDGDNWPVPGGFLTYVVWEKVPGIQLGDSTGAAPYFWKSFPRKEDRAPIQKAFLETFKLSYFHFCIRDLH